MGGVLGEEGLFEAGAPWLGAPELEAELERPWGASGWRLEAGSGFKCGGSERGPAWAGRG